MARRVEARLLRSQERPAVLARLAANAKANLFLLDLTDRIGAPPSPGELRTEIAARLARRRGRRRGRSAAEHRVRRAA